MPSQDPTAPEIGVTDNSDKQPLDNFASVMVTFLRVSNRVVTTHW